MGILQAEMKGHYKQPCEEIKNNGRGTYTDML